MQMPPAACEVGSMSPDTDGLLIANCGYERKFASRIGRDVRSSVSRRGAYPSREAIRDSPLANAHASARAVATATTSLGRQTIE